MFTSFDGRSKAKKIQPGNREWVTLIQAQITKGTVKGMHKVVVMEARMRELEEANRTLSKRRRAKKSRIRAGGPLTIYEATHILESKHVREQLEEDTGRRCGGVASAANPGTTSVHAVGVQK